MKHLRLMSQTGNFNLFAAWPTDSKSLVCWGGKPKCPLLQYPVWHHCVCVSVCAGKVCEGGPCTIAITQQCLPPGVSNCMVFIFNYTFFIWNSYQEFLALNDVIHICSSLQFLSTLTVIDAFHFPMTFLTQLDLIMTKRLANTHDQTMNSHDQTMNSHDQTMNSHDQTMMLQD